MNSINILSWHILLLSPFRYIQEWLNSMVASGVVTSHADYRFSLPYPDSELKTHGHGATVLPILSAMLPKLEAVLPSNGPRGQAFKKCINSQLTLLKCQVILLYLLRKVRKWWKNIKRKSFIAYFFQIFLQWLSYFVKINHFPIFWYIQMIKKDFFLQNLKSNAECFRSCKTIT